MTTASPDPGAVLDKTDPGADTQARFSYQHCFAALQCLRLLSGQLEAVYCENHEDILLRKPGGTYDALQVKTRRFDLDPFKATDAAVKNSIGRFAKLEKAYPARFDGFHFITNHGFWGEKANGTNLTYIRDQICERGNLDGLTKANLLKKFVSGLCGEHGCDEAHVVAAMFKLVLFGQKTDLERPYKDLRETVGDVRDYRRTQTFDTLTRVADNLIYLCQQASSCVLGGEVADLYSLVMDFDAQRDTLLLAGKTITAGRVEEVIRQSLIEDAENLLVASGAVSADVLPPGFDVMVEKLERGGLQMERVDVLKDFKASMETLYLKWLHRHGVEEANRRLVHLKTLVKDDCVEAKLSVEQPGQKYASPMYARLRQLLEDRLRTSTLPMYDCSKEHLLGAAGILTEECTVWWSDRFDLKAVR